MNAVFLHFADWFFLLFHAALSLFNALGWIGRRSRRLNLITLLLTAASWSLLGIFCGWGYCPLTDWHFDILRALGESNLPHSYLQYLAYRLTGFMPDAALTDYFALAVLLSAFGASLSLNIRDRLRKRS